MTASPSHAADRRNGEGDYTAPRSGIERSRIAARFHERRERDHGRAIFPTGPFVSTRTTGRASLKTETHKSRPQARLSVLHSNRAVCPLSGSVIASALPVAGLAGSLLPFWRGSRLFQFVGAIFRPLRSLPLRFNSSQEPKRRVTKKFRSFSSAMFHVDNVDVKGSPCPAKEFPNPEKMFPRIP